MALFRSLDGWPGWSVMGNLFATRSRIARLAGLEPMGLTAGLAARLAHPVEPRIVPSGPVHETVLEGGDAVLDRLPLVTHHERDAAPYVSLGIAVCRDPDTGQRNSSPR